MAEPVPVLRCQCGKLLKLPESSTATHFRCPSCGRRITLDPEKGDTPAEPLPRTEASGPDVSEPTDQTAGKEEGQEHAETPEALVSSAFAAAQRMLVQEARFLRERGYVPSEGWVMAFQRPDLLPEQDPATAPEELCLCVGRRMQSDHYVPVILVVPVVESDTGSRQALRRALHWASSVRPLPVPLSLVTQGDRRRMFQTEGERPYDIIVEAEKAMGYLRGRSQRIAPELRLFDYPLLLREAVAVLTDAGADVGFDSRDFADDLKERFGTDDVEQLTLTQAQEVLVELIERYGSRAPYRLLDIRLLTDQPAPEFDVLGEIVREKLAIEEYREEWFLHAKRILNIFDLGCIVAIFLCVANLRIVAQGAVVLTIAWVIAQGYSRPIPPTISHYTPTYTIRWDRSLTERAALAALCVVVLILMFLG